MNRIDKKFEDLKAINQKAFIGFVTGGDPDIEQTKKLVLALEAAGTDIVEIGVPYSDPLADGPIIQAASQRALDKGLRVKELMTSVKALRLETQIPLLFLVYYNTIFVYGKERFVQDALDAGIDGLIIPDLPLEERDELLPILKEAGIANIPLVAPTSKDRIASITEGCSGFVYCVSSLGVTGRGSDFHENLDSYMKDVRSKTSLPIAIGFGISTTQDIERLAPYADGLIVGSAIVDHIHQNQGNEESLKAFVEPLVGAIKK